MYTFEVVYGVSKFIDLVAAADENLAILEKQLERQERMKYLISKLNDVPSGFAARNMERICEYETGMSIVRIFSEWANDNQEAFEELKKAFDLVNAILGGK